MDIARFANNPIIVPDMDDRMGSNINGPSLIRAPEWLPGRLGEYYLYFAHHAGKYIRLAYADHIEGPWTVYTPGTLQIEQSHFSGHVASPDVHVDHEQRRIRMYYHGCCLPERQPAQAERVAVSHDGIHFAAREEILGDFYWRVFFWSGFYYALAKPGKLYRSRDPLGGFEEGPTLATPGMRHSAVMLDGDVLSVFYSSIGDAPFGGHAGR